QHQSGISVAQLNGNLAPVEKRLAPVGGSPALVQIVERSIARLEPLLKLRLRCGIVRFLGVLIVDLPADHPWIVPKALCECLGDSAGEFAIFRAGKIEVLPIAVLGGTSIFLYPQCFWIF